MNNVRKYLVATTAMVTGTLAVFTSLIVMNELEQAPENKPVVHQTQFEVQKRIEPPKKNTVEKKIEKVKKTHWKPPTALQGLNSQLTGVDVGMPSLELARMIGPADSLLETADDLIMTDDAVDVPPHATSRMPIDYPIEAKAKGIEGFVALNLLIGPSGNVEKIQVLDSTPADVFDQVAVDSVRHWQFEPAVYKGGRVRVWAKQTIRFDLS